MRTFQDNAARTWDIKIDITAAKHVRSLVSVDLLKLAENECRPLAELLNDLVKFVDVLYVLCREQCKSRDVSDEDFGRAMFGDCLEVAAKAFVEEWIDFFPDARRRAMMRSALAAGEKIQAKLMDRAEKAASEIDLEKIAADLASKTFGRSSIISPEPSASTLGSGLSAS